MKILGILISLFSTTKGFLLCIIYFGQMNYFIISHYGQVGWQITPESKFDTFNGIIGIIPYWFLSVDNKLIHMAKQII